MRRLEACYFSASGDPQWERLASVLRSTAAVHCAGWDVQIQRIAPASAQSPTHVQAYERNTQKLRHWIARVEAADDGDSVLLIDADTAILRSLDDLWAEPFDLAYTVRRRVSPFFPFNGGVVAVRVSPLTRGFMAAWLDENERLLQDAEGQRHLQPRFGGLNQMAFGNLLERDHGLCVRQLRCVEWNCEDTTWADFDAGRTRILHVKGALRRVLFRSDPVTPELQRVAAVWRELETQTQSTAVSA